MQAIARWGNFFNQELYGTPTTLPWGIPIDCAHRIEVYACDVLPESTASTRCSCTSRSRARSVRWSSSGSAITSASGFAPATCSWSSSSGTRSSASSSRPSARRTGPSSASRSPSSCRLGSSSRRSSSCSGATGPDTRTTIRRRTPRRRPGAPSGATWRRRPMTTTGTTRTTTGMTTRRSPANRVPARPRCESAGSGLRTSRSRRPDMTRASRGVSGEAAETTSRAGVAGGARRGARRRGRRAGLARPATRGEGVDPLSRPPVGRPVRHLRVLPDQDPDIRPGQPAEGRIPAGRRRSSRLDGSLRRHACDPDGAAGVVPRQRPVDLHLPLAGTAHPSAGRSPAGLARWGRHRAARRLGARRHRQRRRLRADAGRHREWAARPGRCLPLWLGGHRHAGGRADRPAGHRGDGGAVRRASPGLAGPAGHLGPRPGRARGERAVPAGGEPRGTRARAIG